MLSNERHDARQAAGRMRTEHGCQELLLSCFKLDARHLRAISKQVQSAVLHGISLKIMTSRVNRQGLYCRMYLAFYSALIS